MVGLCTQVELFPTGEEAPPVCRYGVSVYTSDIRGERPWWSVVLKSLSLLPSPIVTNRERIKDFFTGCFAVRTDDSVIATMKHSMLNQQEYANALQVLELMPMFIA
eukprot:1160808-Pelagomonas_calceolata.AAC.22